jgi:hypothetical protein
MNELLGTFDETKVFKDLLPFYLEKRVITPSEKEALLQYSAVNYGLIGLIGLLTHDIARILLGKVCDDPFIKKKCNGIKHSLKDLEAIADIYMEIEHSEADEYVFRNVMLKYPRTLLDDQGNFLN